MSETFSTMSGSRPEIGRPAGAAVPLPVNPIIPSANKPAEKLKEITDRLEQGIQDLFESDRYKEYLRVMSRFHNYSLRNTLLIAMQKPDATLIAGYNAWKNIFGRNVMQGERGIRIIAPAPHKIRQEVEKTDPQTGKTVTGGDGRPVMEIKEINIPAYKVVAVFDVSQTEGRELPALSANELTGDVEQYEDFFVALEKTSPVPINFEKIEGKSHGYYHLEGKRIAIDLGMSQLQNLKTVIHEIAHAKLHDIDIKAPKDILKQPDSRTREVEAESVAYTVCQHYGLDTSDYSFGYVAGWSSGRELSELKGSLETIREAAAEIINNIDGHFAQLQQKRDAEKVQDAKAIAEPEQDASENVRLTALQKKAAEIARGYEKLSRQEKIGIIAQAFGCKSGKIETTPCRGKWRGTSDISLRFENGASLVIGNHRTPQAKAVKVQNEYINNALERYNPEIVRVTKEAAADVLRRREIKDNEIAAQKGLKPYTLLGVEFNDGSDDRSGGHMGWYYVTLAVDGSIRAHLETGLNYDIANGSVSETSTREVYFVAGALNESEADYVFNNVGFSSTSDLYSLPLSDEVRKRAEKTLAELGEAPPARAGEDRPETLPDPTISAGDMKRYGYSWDGMLPLRENAAVTLFQKEDMQIFLLHGDGSESIADSTDDIKSHADRGGIMGIHKEDWEALHEYQEMKQELAESTPEKETRLLYGKGDAFGIYQLKDGEGMRDYHFESYDRLQASGLSVEAANYDLIYTAELTPGISLEDIYTRFNIDHPKDFKGHSLSVSDIVVLHQNGENIAHYVDSFGYKEVPEFLHGHNSMKHIEDAIGQNDTVNNPTTVDRLEAKVKAGGQISLVDVANAAKADKERGREAKPEKKPSIRAQLAQDKKRTAPKKAAVKTKDQGLEV